MNNRKLVNGSISDPKININKYNEDEQHRRKACTSDHLLHF